MKVSLTNIADNYLSEYKLSKKIENSFIKESLESSINYSGQDYEYLYLATINGDDKEVGTITEPCGGTQLVKDCNIQHNEGSFNPIRCTATKKINLNTPLDCVGDRLINIFDYEASQTKTLQGNLSREVYYSSEVVYLDFRDYSVDEIILLGGGLPVRHPSYSIESINVRTMAQSTLDENGYQIYTGHVINITINYIVLLSATQHSSKWQPHPSGGYYFTGFEPFEWNTPERHQVQFMESFNYYEYYTNYYFSGGRTFKYRDANISNTVAINPILEDIFSCTGYTLVSNFLGINPDGSSPDNKYYDFGNEYCQNIKIAQSYDIIREAAIQDSFGNSGQIKAKELLKGLIDSFNLLIYFDSSVNLFYIEHVSYFTTKGIDLDNIGNPQTYQFEPLEMNKDLIDAEVFSFAQSTPSSGFYELRIEYRQANIFDEPNENRTQIKGIITDVFGTLNNPEFEQQSYKSLFYLLATDGDNLIDLNESFSMRSLVLNLRDLHRPMKSGNIDDNPITFTGYSIGLSGEIKLKASLLTWDSIYPMFSVKTKYGTFLITETEINEFGEMVLKIKK